MPKKVYRKRRYTTKKPTLARQVAVIKKTLRARKPELKFYGVSSLSNAVDNNPTLIISPYRSITNGDGDFGQRVGDVLRVGSFHWRSSWLLTGSTPRKVRMIAFIYKRNPDAVVSNFSTIINLYMNSATVDSEAVVSTFPDWDNRRSFVTIYDKTRVINPIVDAGSMIQWDTTFKIPQAYRQVQYVNDGSDISANELIIAMIQQYDTNCTVNYQYRYTYTDA